MTVAWVTGGGTGIGRALAEALYADGARVVITGRRQEVLENTAREIAASAGRGEILAIAGDASDAAHIEHVNAEIQRRWGAIDLLINNAGANDFLPFDKVAVQNYEYAFDNNCLSAIRATQTVLPGMLRARHGTIVNISSIYGKISSSNSGSYTVSKFALTGYTGVLRQGLIGTGVHALGVYPGFIETAMTMPFVRRKSLKSYLGKSPRQLALAILAAVRSKKNELNYPWYVPWAYRFYRWVPWLTDQIAFRLKR